MGSLFNLQDNAKISYVGQVVLTNNKQYHHVSPIQ